MPAFWDNTARIAVDQPLAGGSYPFRKFGTSLGNLVADAYLGYEDTGCTPAGPLRIGMLYGFGTIVNSVPDGFNAATHDYDVVILDADDEVVFDSTLLDEDRVLTQNWNDRLTIVEWRGDDATCRIVIFQGADPDDYQQYLAPTDAHLDDRVAERMPRRVRSLRIGLTTLTGDPILDPGYNTEIEVADPATVGTERRTTITIGNTPGAGLGRFSDCDEQSLSVKRINDVSGDDRGSFSLDATACYRWEQPHTIVGGTAVPTEATLRPINNCGPCAECDDFVRVYEAVRRLYARYVALGARAEAVRDQYAANKTRWETEAACRLNNRLRIASVISCPCNLSLAVGFCNTTDDTECLTNLELRVTFSGTVAGNDRTDCGRGFRSGNVSGDCPPPSSACGDTSYMPQAYAPSGTWPVQSFFFDAVKPNGMAVGSLQVQFVSCGTDSLTISVSAYRDGVLLTGPTSTVVTFDGEECCP